MEIFLCIGYISFFVFIILRLNFFKIDGISNTKVIAAFLIKVVSGIILGATRSLRRASFDGRSQKLLTPLLGWVKERKNMLGGSMYIVRCA